MHNRLFVSFGIDQIKDSPCGVPCVESEAAYRIHEELCLRSLPSTLACPAQITLQTENNHFVPQEPSSYDLRLQIILFEQLFRLKTA